MRRLAGSSPGFLAAVALLVGGLSTLAVGLTVGPWAAMGLLALEALALWRFTAFVARPAEQRLQRVGQRMAEQLDAPTPDGLAEFEQLVDRLVDELARSRRHLRRAEGMREAIFEHAPGGVVLIDRSRRVRAVNPAVRAVLPVLPKPVGKRLGLAVPFPDLTALMERTIKEQRPVSSESVSGRFDLALRAVPLEDGGAIAVILDVSSYRREERARADFVTNVSHELRTPITSIVGYAETLLADASRLEPDVVMMLEVIQRNAQRLTTIFQDLLELARLQGKAATLELEDLELGPLLRPLVDGFRLSAAEKELDLELTVPPGLWASVHLEAFKRIVSNLVTNAIRYSPRGEWVRITVEAEGPWAVLQVADNGIGIAPSHHERVFERFYRVDSGRARTAGGTGLGLALVKQLCLATGAEISLRSYPGHGSVFRVKFPVAAQAGEAPSK